MLGVRHGVQANAVATVYGRCKYYHVLHGSFCGHYPSRHLGPKTVTVIPETDDSRNQTLAAYQDTQAC